MRRYVLESTEDEYIAILNIVQAWCQDRGFIFDGPEDHGNWIAAVEAEVISEAAYRVGCKFNEAAWFGFKP